MINYLHVLYSRTIKEKNNSLKSTPVRVGAEISFSTGKVKLLLHPRPKYQSA